MNDKTTTQSTPTTPTQAELREDLDKIMRTLAGCQRDRYFGEVAIELRGGRLGLLTKKQTFTSRDLP